MPLKIVKKAANFALDDGGSIKARVVRSGLWVGLSQVGQTVLNMARSVVLARLLTPEMFGLMGLAMIVVRAIETFTRPGVAQALIASQRDFEEASATAFTLLIMRGVLLTAALTAVAPLVGRFYEAEALGPMLQALSAVFLIGSFVNINTIARQRELDFRKLTYLTQTTNVLGTIVTIGMAFWIRSAWALVIGQIVSVTLNALLSYYFIPGRPRFAFNRAVASDLLAYGKFITGSSMVMYVAAELDSAVIGKMLGTGELGFYTLAMTISSLVTLNLSKIASGIMMPAYSKLQSDIPALRNAYLRALALMMFVVAPATAGLIVLAEPAIDVVYGDKWVAAAVPLQILAFFGMIRALLSFNGYLFEGMGKPKVAFQLGLLRLATIAPLMVPMILAYGLKGAAITVTAGSAVQWLTGMVFLRRYLQIGFMQVMGSIWRSLWTSAAMGLAVYLMSRVVDARTVFGLLATVLCGMVVYAVLNVAFLRKLKNERLR